MMEMQRTYIELAIWSQAKEGSDCLQQILRHRDDHAAREAEVYYDQTFRQIDCP